MTDQTATELDKSRRYLRPVRATIISDDPNGVHLAVYSWLPMFEAWVTGPGICGESMMQGPLSEGTVVTCPRCEEWRPKYERYLAPGYDPADDDPEALRARAAKAEVALARVLELADDVDDPEWRASGTEVAARFRSAVAGESEDGRASRQVHVTITNPDEFTANRSALSLVDWIRAEFPGMRVVTDAREWEVPG
jgi:hypothetical protein